MVDVLIGLQWGDEGKGKIVDLLAPKYDIIARFQGGPNAGHTLVIEGKKYVLHTIPSGIIHENTINVIGTGTVIDPITLQEEIELLKAEGIDAGNRIKISDKAHLIMPTHKLLDKYYELSKGAKKIGSTLRGIGPCYEDKYARTGLRVADVLSLDFKAAYDKLKQHHLKILNALGFRDEEDLSSMEDAWFKSADILTKMQIEKIEHFINSQMLDGAKILAEGAQGSLLDITFGSYPFVTSSNTISASACVGLGIAPQKINKVFGVYKAYMTRVGSGPFPSELNNETGHTLMKAGNEYGATTGRERRCGWLDLQLLRESIVQNGVTDLIITKSDVLNSLSRFSAIDTKGNTQTFDSWSEDLSEISSFDSCPKNFKNYLDFIDEEVNLKTNNISTGPGREEIIYRS